MLIDPGEYSSGQDEVKNIDAILITHEHADHVSLESLKKVLENNLKAKIFGNESVCELLAKEGIEVQKVKNSESFSVKNVLIEVLGADHVQMHLSIPPIRNVGYLIAGKFFYPGDAFTKPEKSVEILALPIAGPWMKLSEAIDYALELAPKVCFPVHDGILKSFGGTRIFPPQVLEPRGIRFQVLEDGSEVEF